MLRKIKSYLSNSNNIIYKNILASKIKIDNSKNFISIFCLNIITKKLKKKEYKYAIYIDNEDFSSMIQLEKWFQNGFFNKKNILIIIREFSLVNNNFIKYLDNNEYDFYSFKIIKKLDVSLYNIEYMFYLFNSFTNPVMIKNRKIKHIWIGHGESDKLASVNPMIRMYDYSFVSGNIAVERLVKHNIITICHIENHKILKIGMPYMDKISIENKKEIKNSKIKKILYAPTWEGVEKEQEYSSLDENFGYKVIKEILSDDSFEYELSFKPHPSTGIKHSCYINYIVKFIENISKLTQCTLILNQNSFLFSQLKSKKYYIQEDIEYSEYDLVITDNSSIIAYLIYHKINYLTLLTKEYNLDKWPLLNLSTCVNYKNYLNIKDSINKELIIDKALKYNKVISSYNLNDNKLLDFIIQEIESKELNV